MGSAVQFDGDAAVHTEKVDNVATYAELSAELLSEDLAPLKMLPQDSFCRRGIISQFLTTRFERRDISGA
jgi:hypothetical protein